MDRDVGLASITNACDVEKSSSGSGIGYFRVLLTDMSDYVDCRNCLMESKNRNIAALDTAVPLHCVWLIDGVLSLMMESLLSCALKSNEINWLESVIG